MDVDGELDTVGSDDGEFDPSTVVDVDTDGAPEGTLDGLILEPGMLLVLG